MSVSTCVIWLVALQFVSHVCVTYVCSNGESCGPACTSVVGGGCQPCAPGTYKDTVNPQECMTCPEDTYSEDMSSHYTMCPVGLWSSSGSRGSAKWCMPGLTYMENSYYVLLTIQPKLLACCTQCVCLWTLLLASGWLLGIQCHLSTWRLVDTIRSISGVSKDYFWFRSQLHGHQRETSDLGEWAGRGGRGADSGTGSGGDLEHGEKYWVRHIPNPSDRGPGHLHNLCIGI